MPNDRGQSKKCRMPKRKRQKARLEWIFWKRRTLSGVRKMTCDD